MNEIVNLAEMAVPAQVLELDALARRVETPCGEGTMTWRIWGEGDPVVLAHGAQGDWTHWIRNIGPLSADRMVIVPDLPGHGDSVLPETSDHAGISAALATGLKQILGDKLPVDLVGFSFGGVCFSYLAGLHPEVARRVILIGCGGLDTPTGDIDVRSIKGLEGAARMQRLKANLLGLMLANEENVDEFAIWQLVTNGRKAKINPQMLVLPDRILRILPDVKVPVDAIWGERDRPHPDPQCQKEALLPFKPDIDFRVIEGSGHWAMYDRAEAFNATLKDMLDGGA